MRRNIANCIPALAIAGFCLMLAGTFETARADAPASKVEKPAPLRIGWGEPQDGLQIGLFPSSIQKTFRYGSALTLTLRVRNVSRAPIAFTMKAPEISSVTLGENGRLVLQTLGRSRDTIAFRLAPGETSDLTGGRYRAQIIAPGEEPPKTEEGLPVLALLPGEYLVECSYPIWMPDKNDASRATAHRAKPGVFTFKVQGNEARPSSAKRDAKLMDTSILWGETVNGLQGGLKRVTPQDMAALPADKRKEMPDDGILTWYYIRNTTDRPLRLSYFDFHDNDASYWVQDAQGKDCQVHTTFFSGLRAMSDHLLLPGAIVQAGEGTVSFHARPTPLLVSDYTPTLMAEPGQYTLRVISSARFTGLNGLDMVLISGAVPFTVTPQ